MDRAKVVVRYTFNDARQTPISFPFTGKDDVGVLDLAVVTAIYDVQKIDSDPGATLGVDYPRDSDESTTVRALADQAKAAGVGNVIYKVDDGPDRKLTT